MEKSTKYYNYNIEKIKNILDKIEKRIVIFSIIRFIIVALVVIFMYFFFKADNIYGLTISLFIGILVFGVIAFFHNEVINKKKTYLLKLEYNENGIKRLNGQWKEFKDNGNEYIDLNHSFTSDLDIFGENSLFQWINTTRTIFGRESLADKLKLKGLLSRDEIELNQQAIKELINKREFCESIYIKGASESDKNENLEELLKWVRKKDENSFTIRYIPYFFIAITTIMIILIIDGKIPVTYLLLDLAINYLVIKLLTRNLSDVINIFINNKRKIIQYSSILNIIQDEEFTSIKLSKLKKLLLSSNKSCKNEMLKLKNIISWLGDSTSNAYYLIINVFFMSDIFILYNLEQWKKRNGIFLEKWLHVMGEVESIICLSNLAFEHEKWSYPIITVNGGVEAINLGHPMLGDKAKRNDFKLIGKEKAALITGSNMSGKSTFLRTVGFNMILAYLGLPTYSDRFKCGLYKIYTCMRTQDNLEENISSFYAEILRIKLVITAAKEGEKVFFLLDEIFKGTNSQDRHDGARILIEQLIKLEGIGLVSTHDLELCSLEKENQWLVNYNFKEYYKGNNIYFDYTLREGSSKTKNAKYLMKLAGIEIEE